MLERTLLATSCLGRPDRRLNERLDAKDAFTAMHLHKIAANPICRPFLVIGSAYPPPLPSAS